MTDDEQLADMSRQLAELLSGFTIRHEAGIMVDMVVVVRDGREVGRMMDYQPWTIEAVEDMIADDLREHPSPLFSPVPRKRTCPT